MTALFAIFVAQVLDPVRIVLALAASWWALQQAPRGKRFTPLSVIILGITALMSFLLSMMAITPPNPNMLAISFVVGLFSTGVLVGISVLILTRLFKY